MDDETDEPFFQPGGVSFLIQLVVWIVLMKLVMGLAHAALTGLRQ